MEAEFAKHNVDIERFPAVDGKKIRVDDKLHKLFANNKFNWRAGIMGATLSHTTLWQKLVDSDDDYYLIFEDDIVLHEKFETYLERFNDVLTEHNPEFVFMGYHTDKRQLTEPKMFGINDSREFFVYKVPITKHIWGGLFGYAISKPFAKKLLDDINENGIQDPIDTYIVNKADIFCTYPIIVTSPFMTFYNFVDSDIQYDLLSIHDDYDFYPELDSPGSDIRWSQAKTFEQLKAEADADDNCVAFNTYAFLKYQIITPDKFQKLPGINSKSHGIYIKRNHPKNQEYRDYLNKS